MSCGVTRCMRSCAVMSTTVMLALANACLFLQDLCHYIHSNH